MAASPSQLSAKEFDLLVALAEDPERVFKKEELLRDVWGFRSLGRTRTLDSHASRLRRKLNLNGEAAYVVNVWGVGYRLVPGARSGASKRDLAACWVSWRSWMPLPRKPGVRHPCFRRWLQAAPPPGAIRVLLAEADRPFARELMRTLTAEERFDIVGCARDGREAVELATALLPDVVLMGMEMPALDAVETTRRIRARFRRRAFSSWAPRSAVEVDLALAAGAAGFIRRSSSSADLAAAILGLAPWYSRSIRAPWLGVGRSRRSPLIGS